MIPRSPWSTRPARCCSPRPTSAALKYKRGWHAAPDPFGLIEPILDNYVPAGPVSANLTWSRAALGSTRLLAPLSRWGLAALERARLSDLELQTRVGMVFPARPLPGAGLGGRPAVEPGTTPARAKRFPLPPTESELEPSPLPRRDRLLFEPVRGRAVRGGRRHGRGLKYGHLFVPWRQDRPPRSPALHQPRELGHLLQPDLLCRRLRPSRRGRMETDGVGRLRHSSTRSFTVSCGRP